MSLVIALVLALFAPSAIAQIGGGGGGLCSDSQFALLSTAESAGVTITITISGANGRAACNKLGDSWNAQLGAVLASLDPSFPAQKPFLIQPFSCSNPSIRTTKLEATMTPYTYWTFTNMAATCAYPAGSALLCSTYVSTQLPPLLLSPNNFCPQRDLMGAVTIDELSSKVAAAVRGTSVSWVDSLGGVGSNFATRGSRKALF